MPAILLAYKAHSVIPCAHQVAAGYNLQSASVHTLLDWL